MSDAPLRDQATARKILAETPESPNVELARRAIAGDASATGELLRALAPRIARVVRATLGAGHADLDDAIQQSLIGFVQALPAFRGECDPSGYATVIAVRAALVVRRKTSTSRTRHDHAVETDAVIAGHPSPGEDAAATQRREVLRDLLASIPSEQAEALAMRIVLGYSLEEIASQSGAPLNTVRSRLRLAKESLKRRIESDPNLVDALDVVPS
jgi:RNA polymerase sigma factor (sigma-70 family)